ncbi:MAG: hypothetical protein AVDCRST_MAG56-4493 [uncultured Cytophagales bacterium]|uniref:Lipoprotein n=1 Tax=uncultured Cytophagales bacterium TaxID=158755 RepID=A0A6J4JXF4_9SPHI|nr:MAG: hypothetical protein AVDCRST_MAG56-4493 [uncultured Cytophagales bacterium]
MKRLIVALALLGTLSQCARDVTPSRVQGRLNETLSLQPDQTAQLGGQSDGSGANGALAVRVLSAKDERCPSWANCVSPGSAGATVLVSQGTAASDTLQLCLGLCDFTASLKETDQVSFNLGADAYVLHLESIHSREKPGQPTAVERVNLLLEKK